MSVSSRAYGPYPHGLSGGWTVSDMGSFVWISPPYFLLTVYLLYKRIGFIASSYMNIMCSAHIHTLSPYVFTSPLIHHLPYPK